MKLTREQVRVLAAAVDLTIPEKDLDNVTIRTSALLTAMDEIERDLGNEMDEVDPVPPVFPHEEF
jgi:hypothetical protein